MCRNAHDFFVVSDTLITFMACNINDKLMTVTDRFLKYVTFDTESSETTGVTPSTPGQRVFAEALVKELEEIGLEDITLDDKSYLMATPACQYGEGSSDNRLYRPSGYQPRYVGQGCRAAYRKLRRGISCCAPKKTWCFRRLCFPNWTIIKDRISS